MDHSCYGWPQKQGLYDPYYEKDACGVGFVVSIDGIRSRKVCIEGCLRTIKNLHTLQFQYLIVVKKFMISKFSS